MKTYFTVPCAFFALVIATACAKTAPGSARPGNETAQAAPERILPDFQARVRPNLARSADILMGVDSQFTQVIAYGRWLDGHPLGDPDSLTVRSDLYWNAFVTMAMRDPLVYLTRIYLLIGDGRLARARYVRIFAYFHMDRRKETDESLMHDLGAGMQEIQQASDGLVEKGIAAYDRGEMEAAKRFYADALGIYPKSPRAHYELGLTLLTAGLKQGRIENDSSQACFARVRAYDPFYAFAYQGPKALVAKMSIVMKEIDPALKALTGGGPDAGDFRKFADACVKLGEWELAAYAYHTELFMTLDDRKGFDPVPAGNFARCLRELGATGAAREIADQFRLYNEQLTAKKDKRKG